MRNMVDDCEYQTKYFMGSFTNFNKQDSSCIIHIKSHARTYVITEHDQIVHVLVTTDICSLGDIYQKFFV